MKKLYGLAAALGLFIAATFAFTAPLPLMPSSPTFSEPSQIVGTLNALINQLNGSAGGYTAGSATNVVSFGSFCTNTAGGTPQVCNGQRGLVLFTGLTVAATGTNQVIVVTNSFVTAASACQAQFNSAFTAGSAVVVATVTPSAGSLSVVIANAGATTNAVTTGTLEFNCFS